MLQTYSLIKHNKCNIFLKKYGLLTSSIVNGFTHDSMPNWSLHDTSHTKNVVSPTTTRDKVATKGYETALIKLLALIMLLEFKE